MFQTIPQDALVGSWPHAGRKSGWRRVGALPEGRFGPVPSLPTNWTERCPLVWRFTPWVSRGYLSQAVWRVRVSRYLQTLYSKVADNVPSASLRFDARYRNLGCDAEA